MTRSLDEERRDPFSPDARVHDQKRNFISGGATSGCFDYRHERTSLPSRNQSCPRRRLRQEGMKQTESFLAAEMSQLSVQEMSKALDDVHCVGEAIVETPELIQRALSTFGEEARAQSNSVYDIALQQNRQYVEGEAFRLKFLRCNLFEIKSSVSQMMQFLQYKAKYYGIHKLGLT